MQDVGRNCCILYAGSSAKPGLVEALCDQLNRHDHSLFQFPPASSGYAAHCFGSAFFVHLLPVRSKYQVLLSFLTNVISVHRSKLGVLCGEREIYREGL